MTLTHGNGATAGYSYNAAGWVTNLVNAKSSAVTITSHAYSYDAVGNPVGMTEATGDVLTWTYDALNQLTREQRSGDNAYDITYTYDPVGNRLTKVDSGAVTTYTYDAVNALTLEDTGGTLTTYSYDENGNTLAWNAAGSRTTLTWGYEDEVLTVQPSSGDPVTMTYDGDHMRRQREEGAATAKYLWDGAQILLDLDGSDATVARYTLAPFGYGDLLSQRRSSATSFYHFDALGSVRALTDADEGITDTYLYDAWGVPKASTGSTTNPYRYVGRLGYLREAALDGYLLRRRYYRPAVGRFVSRGPVYWAGLSGYMHVRGWATRAIDAGGLQGPPPGGYPPPGSPEPEPPGAFPPEEPPKTPPLGYVGPGGHHLPPPVIALPLPPELRPLGPGPIQPPGWKPWPWPEGEGLPARYGAWWGNQIPCGKIVTRWMRCFRRAYHEAWCKACAVGAAEACTSLPDLYQQLWCLNVQAERYALCLKTAGWIYPPLPVLPL